MTGRNAWPQGWTTKPVGLEALRDCVSAWLPDAPVGTDQDGTDQVAVPDATQDVTPILDEKVLLELREIMDDDYLSLLQTYLRNAPQLVEEIRTAIRQADVEAMVLPIHSLKSSSANVGAMQLSELAREAERLARAGQLRDAEALFRSMDSAFSTAEAALRDHLKNYNAA